MYDTAAATDLLLYCSCCCRRHTAEVLTTIAATPATVADLQLLLLLLYSKHTAPAPANLTLVDSETYSTAAAAHAPTGNAARAGLLVAVAAADPPDCSYC